MSAAGKTIQCKAAVAWEKDAPLVIETVEVAPPGPKEVRVKIVASGLCYSDANSLSGNFAPRFPIILGHEGSGIVESIGEGVTTVVPGDKVLTLIIPYCENCHTCKSLNGRMCLLTSKDGRPRFQTMADGTCRFTCKGKQIYHMSGTSTFSEYTVCPEICIAKINENAPLESVCIYACGFPTGYGSAINQSNARPGSSVAIWGLGGVGLSAVLGAKNTGATRIIGIDTNSTKFEIARKIGCTDCIDPAASEKSTVEIINEMTGKLLDCAIVCVGNIKAMTEAIECTAPSGGTVLIVGITHDTLPIPANVFLSGIKIIGSLMGGYNLRQDVPKLVEQYIKGEINSDPLITHTFKLEEVNEAFKCFKDGVCIRSRILL